jgi:hypothetical protein
MGWQPEAEGERARTPTHPQGGSCRVWQLLCVRACGRGREGQKNGLRCVCVCVCVICLINTSPSPREKTQSRMPS